MCDPSGSFASPALKMQVSESGSIFPPRFIRRNAPGLAACSPQSARHTQGAWTPRDEDKDVTHLPARLRGASVKAPTPNRKRLVPLCCVGRARVERLFLCASPLVPSAQWGVVGSGAGAGNIARLVVPGSVFDGFAAAMQGRRGWHRKRRPPLRRRRRTRSTQPPPPRCVRRARRRGGKRGCALWRRRSLSPRGARRWRRTSAGGGPPRNESWRLRRPPSGRPGRATQLRDAAAAPGRCLLPRPGAAAPTMVWFGSGARDPRRRLSCTAPGRVLLTVCCRPAQPPARR